MPAHKILRKGRVTKHKNNAPEKGTEMEKKSF